MNYLELQNECASALERAGIGNFRNESRWLVLETLQLPASALYSDCPVSLEDITFVRKQCARRCQHEPLQYILGSAPFAELELNVDPNVLIPRSETVILVEYALDKSPGALKVASGNARMLELESRVKFFESDLLSGVPAMKFDCIAANLPYVTEEEYALLADDVRLFEPEMALTAPDEGMALISRLIVSAPEYLNTNGCLALEMAPPQTARAVRELEARGFGQTEVFADQFGKKRFAAGRWR